MFDEDRAKLEAAYRHVIVASHQRSGTHLTIDLLRANFGQLGNDYVNIDRMLPKHAQRQHQFLLAADCRALLGKEVGKNIIKTHATPELTEFAYDRSALEVAKDIKQESRIIYVYRDGRDVMASLYYFEKHKVPKPPECTFAEFLRSPSRRIPSGWPADTTPPERWARHVSEWLDVEGCLGISYEETMRDPDATIRKIGGFLELPVPRSARRIKLHRPSIPARLFRRLSGKHFASSAVLPRKGVVGDWVNHFSKDDEALFWDRAGPVMERLGYT